MLGERGAQVVVAGTRTGARSARATVAPIAVDGLGRACGRPRAAGRCPASTYSCIPATRTMKNSSRLRRVDRAELHALEQRDARVLGELQHAVVEVEPGELAVEVQRRARSRSTAALRRRRLLLEVGHGVAMLTPLSRRRRCARRSRIEPCAEALALELVPQLEEAGEQQPGGGRAGTPPAPRRPAWSRGVRRLLEQRRVEVLGVAGRVVERGDVGGQQAARRPRRSPGSGRRSRGSRPAGPGGP